MPYDDILSPNALLLVSDGFGVYIPQTFTERVSFERVRNVDPADWAIIAKGPTLDNEHYWEAWDCILSAAILYDDSGAEHHLWQDGDLWAVPMDTAIPGDGE
jgi:hypothetical protein